MNKLALWVNRRVSDQAEEMLTGYTIAVTAERRAHQQVRYFESRGATVQWVPVLRTVEGSSRSELHATTTEIIEEPIDLLIIHTGQVLDWWLNTVPEGTRPLLDDALSCAGVLARGSKASSAARRHGLDVVWQAPDEKVSDIVDHLSSMDLSGVRCVVLADGNHDRQVLEAARSCGADAIEVEVYRYAIPDEHRDIDGLIDAITDRRIDIVTFTASPTIRHLRSIAAGSGRLDALDVAMRTHCRAAVVGPVCAATASDAGWSQLIEPTTARLIPMLDAVTEALDPH